MRTHETRIRPFWWKNKEKSSRIAQSETKLVKAHKYRYSVCEQAEGSKEDWGQSFIIKRRCYARKWFSAKKK